MSAKTDVIIANCREGSHSLEVICSTYDTPLSEKVVRWCRKCGSIVIGIDYDGRTNPGQEMKIRSPEISRVLSQ